MDSGESGVFPQCKYDPLSGQPPQLDAAPWYYCRSTTCGFESDETNELGQYCGVWSNTRASGFAPAVPTAFGPLQGSRVLLVNGAPEVILESHPNFYLDISINYIIADSRAVLQVVSINPFDVTQKAVIHTSHGSAPGTWQTFFSPVAHSDGRAIFMHPDHCAMSKFHIVVTLNGAPIGSVGLDDVVHTLYPPGLDHISRC